MTYLPFSRQRSLRVYVSGSASENKTLFHGSVFPIVRIFIQLVEIYFFVLFSFLYMPTDSFCFFVSIVANKNALC